MRCDDLILKFHAKFPSEKTVPEETKDFGKPTAQNFNYVIKKLFSLGLVAREESSGRDVYYHTTGDVNMVFGAKS